MPEPFAKGSPEYEAALERLKVVPEVVQAALSFALATLQLYHNGTEEQWNAVLTQPRTPEGLVEVLTNGLSATFTVKMSAEAWKAERDRSISMITKYALFSAMMHGEQAH